MHSLHLFMTLNSQVNENKRESETLSQPQMGETMKVEAVRIAVGSRIFHVNCKISFQPGGKQQYISLLYTRSVVNPPSTTNIEHKFFLDDKSITDLKYFIPSAADDDDDDTSFDNRESQDDAMSFLAMRINPTESNRLTDYPRAYLTDEQLDTRDSTMLGKKRFIVIEFRKSDEFLKLLASMRKNPILVNMLNDSAKLTSLDSRFYSEVLRLDNKIERATRMKSLTRHESTNKVLLVYPFNGNDDAIENAAKGLKEAKIQIGKENVVAVQAEVNNEASDAQDKSVRGHYLTIRDEDRHRLTNDEFLNDTLVDFWMQW